MPQVRTPKDDPWDEVRALRRDLNELTRRVDIAATMKDSAGNILAATDAVTGMHLGRPYLPVVWSSARPSFYHLFYASGATVPGEDMWQATIHKQHPGIAVAVGTSTEDGATTGALRLLANGVQIGSDVAFGNAPARSILGPFPVPGGHMDPVVLTLQAWRTAGTALVRAWPQDTYGRET